MIISRNMLKRVGESRHPCRTPNCSEPVSYAAIEEDYTVGLVIEVFDDSDKVGANVVLLNGCPQNYMPNPVKGFLKFYQDMVEVLLLLELFHSKDSSDENVPCGAPSCSEVCLLFSDDRLRLRLQYEF